MEKEDLRKKEDRDRNEKDDTEHHDSLREFITKKCEEQLQLQDNDIAADVIQQERMNQFFQRAISESERMNSEVHRSRSQQQKLYEELGKDIFESWSKDHASEVLTPEQYQSWKNEEEKSSKAFLQNKMLQNKLSDEDNIR